MKLTCPQCNTTLYVGDASPRTTCTSCGNVVATGVAGATEHATDESYLDAPPGEATQIFMATAGIYRGRRNKKIAAITSAVLATLVALVLIGDLTGLISIPMMGAVYDFTGLKDPNRDRAIKRVETKLVASNLSPEETEKLRRKLLGLGGDESHVKTRTRVASPHPAAAQLAAQPAATPTAVGADKPLGPGNAPTNAPLKALGQDAISKVVADNNRSMALCVAEASHRGENPRGKMEIQMTIAPNGDVKEAEIVTDKFKNSVVGACSVRRVRGWKFPQFTGDAVTVVFPYVLSTGL